MVNAQIKVISGCLNGCVTRPAICDVGSELPQQHLSHFNSPAVNLDCKLGGRIG